MSAMVPENHEDIEFEVSSVVAALETVALDFALAPLRA
ncbi:hypothetical protein CKA32_006430 [Geitlerinema sp. FC II]|nr:hypothetical protein CKA32_006430 [Geitlerinema sp. FC II]